MTLLFCDGFEDGLADWAATGSPTNPSSGRNGFYANVQTTSNLIRTITPSTTVTVGFAGKIDSLSSAGSSVSTSNHFLHFGADAGVVWHVGLHILNTGVLHATRAPQGTPVSLGAASGTIAINTWYYFEMQVTIHDTTGSVVLRVNNSTVLNVTGIDTRNAGTSMLIDRIRINGVSGANNWFDDLYILDSTGTANNDFLGDLAVEHIRPTGNDVSQWVGSDGNSTDNYQLVDDAGAAVTTDYVGSPTVGNRDLYTTPGSVRGTGNVYGVYVDSSMTKSDSGAKSAGLCVKEGAAGTLRTGTSRALTTGYLKYGEAFDRKADGSAWTFADLQALRIGVEVTA